MSTELCELSIDIIQRWLEQDGDPPSCRLSTRCVSVTELVELMVIREQEEAIYQDACLEAGIRWQHSLELRGCQGELVSVPFLAQIKIKYSLERLKQLVSSGALATYTHWYDQQGWTDLFVYGGRFWAFPPGAVLPLPVSFIRER